MADEEVAIDEAPATRPAARRGVLLGSILQVVNTALLLVVLALQVLRPGAVRRAPHADDAHAAPATAAAETAASATASAKSADAAAGAPGPTLRLSDFIVHLRDPDADRYARVSFEVELKDEKAKEGLNARLPQLRDAFLVYLSDRSSEDLRGGEAIARVKAALGQRLGEVAKDVPIRALYMTELVVQ